MFSAILPESKSSGKYVHSVNDKRQLNRAHSHRLPVQQLVAVLALFCTIAKLHAHLPYCCLVQDCLILHAAMDVISSDAEQSMSFVLLEPLMACY